MYAKFDIYVTSSKEDFSPVTFAIIALCVWLFVIYFALEHLVGLSSAQSFTLKLGFMPAELFADSNIIRIALHSMTLISYMFFHSSFFHLLGNLFWLFLYFPSIEKSLGGKKFFVFFILAGVMTALLYILMMPAVLDNQAIFMGASGAIAAILGVFVALHANANFIVNLYFSKDRVFKFCFSALWPIAFKFCKDIYYGVFIGLIEGLSSTAYLAHLLGFIAGFILAMFYKRYI